MLQLDQWRAHSAVFSAYYYSQQELSVARLGWFPPQLAILIELDWGNYLILLLLAFSWRSGVSLVWMEQNYAVTLVFC